MREIILIALIASSITLSQACWKPANDPRVPNAAEDIYPCNSTTAKTQIRNFLSHLKQHRHASACAEHWWLGAMAELKIKQKQQHATIADVGCNKAYFSATALNYLAPGYGNHLQLFFKSHEGRNVYAKPCGGCNECRQRPPQQTAGEQQLVDVFCFEPSEVHIASLRQARDDLYGPPDGKSKRDSGHATTKVNFHVLQAAMSNSSGVAHFPVNCTSNTCSLAARNATFQAVNVTTLDDHMRSAGVSFLDVMKIDTEGFDPAVLAGAYQSLRNHRVGLLSFEYHRLWDRSGGTLKQCVRYLDDLGYACFYDGPTLAKLSGACWKDAYELRRWTNVVCVLRGTDMERELVQGSYLVKRGKQ